MKHTLKLLFAGLVSMLLFACSNTIVTPDENTENIRLIGLNEALDNCQQLGYVDVRFIAFFGGQIREDAIMDDDTSTLVKNRAITAFPDGNAITPWGEVEETGRQRYGVYECPGS